jgi:hypothetical protein
MFYHQDSTFEALSIHHVGNKSQDEFYALSESPVNLKSDEVLPLLLMQYFMTPFAKAKEVYRLNHPNGDLMLNEVYHFASKFFNDEISFHAMSEHLAKHLYEVSTHPKIKSGELYVVSLKDVQMEGELHDAIGIFKTENRESYLKVNPLNGGFDISYDETGINTNKLDKGVIIINDEHDQGYKVLVADAAKVTDAVFWKDDFLNVIARNDEYQQTTNLLKVYKNFVTDKLDETFELEKADKIDLLNRSMNYFKEKETFDQEEFEEEIIGTPLAIESFKSFKKQFEDDYEVSLPNSFEINANAVKKQESSYKNIIKLDKNFVITVNGKCQYIEKGFDEDKGMNFYKLYFENES